MRVSAEGGLDVGVAGEAGPDEGLMAAYAGGDAAAFKILYARYADSLYRYCLHCVHQPDLAADITQEVWLSLARSRSRYVASSAFRHFIFRIAHNQVVTHWRRQTAQGRQDPLADDLAADSDPEQEAIDSNLHLSLHEAIARLPAPQREVILLRLEAELSLEAIAEIQQADYEAVKTRHRLAVTKLRRWMGHG